MRKSAGGAAKAFNLPKSIWPCMGKSPGVARTAFRCVPEGTSMGREGTGASGSIAGFSGGAEAQPAKKIAVLRALKMRRARADFAKNDISKNVNLFTKILKEIDDSEVKQSFENS